MLATETMKSLSLIVILSIALSACDSGVEWSEGEYEVHWIDTSQNRSLARKIDSSSSIGRVGAEVIAVGSNDKHVVAKQRSIGTNSISYFVINKAKDGKLLNQDEITEGPFSEKRFLELQKELGLPGFSKEF